MTKKPLQNLQRLFMEKIKQLFERENSFFDNADSVS